MVLTIPTVDNTYILETPANHFKQGGRDVYSFVLDLAAMDALLPERVDEDIVKDANRRLTPSHAKRIQEYLAMRDDWVLGSLLLGIAPEALEFTPGQDQEGNANLAFGVLRIRTDLKSTLKIFDGQHRRRAITDVIAELRNRNQGSPQLASLLDSSVSIVLYAEEKIKALQQMFVDASKTKAIEANTITRFDERDALNLAAMRMAENSDLFRGRVEMERTAVQRNSQCLVSINQLARILKTLEFGYKGRVSRDRNAELMDNLEGLLERCLDWSDSFMPNARPEFNGLLSGDIGNEEIPQLRPRTFAYNASVIGAMAGCLYEWRKMERDDASLAHFFSAASLDRGSESGSLFHDAGMIAANGTVLASNPIVLEAINKIVRKAEESAV